MHLTVLIVALHAAHIDMRFRVLPNVFTSFIAIIGMSYCLLSETAPVPLYWMSTVSHFVVGMVFPSGFGMGDVKMFAGLGLFLHTHEWFLAWIALSYGSTLVWGLLTRQKSVAFGPHIVMAWVLCCVGDYSHVSLPDRW